MLYKKKFCLFKTKKPTKQIFLTFPPIKNLKNNYFKILLQ